MKGCNRGANRLTQLTRSLQVVALNGLLSFMSQFDSGERRWDGGGWPWPRVEAMKRQKRNKAGRAKYQQMWDVTTGVINSWDPYGLLGGGAPGDEFDQEIASLVARIPRIHSAADAAEAISRIFASSFEPHSFTEDMCSEVGEALYSALVKQGLSS